MCACVVLTFSVGIHLALGPIALRAYRLYGLSYAYSPKRVRLDPLGLSYAPPGGKLSTQRFTTRLARA